MKYSSRYLKVLALSILLSASHSVWAQQSDSLVKKITDQMKTQLKLSEAQYSKIYPLNAHFIADYRSLKASGASRLQIYGHIQASAKEREAALKNILSKEQYQSFEQHKKANREQMKQALNK